MRDREIDHFVDYMGKRMTYDLAIRFLIAVEPGIQAMHEREQITLVDLEYAPDRTLSYRSQGGETIPYAYIDNPDTPQSEARLRLEALIDALPQPDWLHAYGGGGPIELIDPEVLASFLAVVKDVAKEFVQPIFIGVAINVVSLYTNRRLTKKQTEQQSEIYNLTYRVKELEAKLAQREPQGDIEDKHDEEDQIVPSRLTAEAPSEMESNT